MFEDPRSSASCRRIPTVRVLERTLSPVRFAAGLVAAAAALTATDHASAQTLVVRNYNVLADSAKKDRDDVRQWPSTDVRMKRAAQRFVADTPDQVGIIALQEAGDKVRNCGPVPIGRVTASVCMVQALRTVYPGGDPGYAESLKSGLGLVWDRNVWQEVTRKTWPLPRRPSCKAAWIWPCWVSADVLQVTLHHRATGRVLTVLNTHLAPADKYRFERRRQVLRLLPIAASAVRPGQLPALLIGDMNFSLPSEPFNFHHLNGGFRLANDPNGIEHVWIGRRPWFRSGAVDLCVVRSAVLDFRPQQILITSRRYWRLSRVRTADPQHPELRRPRESLPLRVSSAICWP